jgi:hypothetical protein
MGTEDTAVRVSAEIQSINLTCYTYARHRERHLRASCCQPARYPTSRQLWIHSLSDLCTLSTYQKVEVGGGFPTDLLCVFFDRNHETVQL